MNENPPDIRAIRQARDAIDGLVHRTPSVPSRTLSRMAGCRVTLKLENLQKTGSFKPRGALVNMKGLQEDERARGVVTISAGNHAQGVACAAAMLGAKSLVVMPETTPLAKILAARDYGAEVELCGASYDDAALRAAELREQRDLLYVPAFDHPLIMAGQGTIGLEILEQLPEADTLVVPIGGGGLISGIASAAKALKPSIRIVGVEAAGAPSALLARRKGKPLTLAAARSLADGIVVKRVGELTHPVLEALVDDIVVVEEGEIARSIVSLMEKGKLVVEGAGAVSLAAVLYGGRKVHRGRTVCLLSGGNIDVQTIARVVERGMMAEGRFLKVQVEIDDAPGSLARLAALLGECGANIFHVSHDRRRADVPLGRAVVNLELETRGGEHIGEVLELLDKSGYGAQVLR